MYIHSAIFILYSYSLVRSTCKRRGFTFRPSETLADPKLTMLGDRHRCIWKGTADWDGMGGGVLL